MRRLHVSKVPAIRLVILLTFTLSIPFSVEAQTDSVQPAVRTRSVTNNTASTSPAGTSADERYQIGPGDVIEVLVYNHPQLSRPSIRVDGRGMIRIPLLEGEIKAACKTEADLSNELTERFREYHKHPQVDVYVREFNSKPVAILGAVRSPGRFQLQRRIRLLELLTFSGGATTNAGSTIQIVHQGSGLQTCVDEPKSVEEDDDVLSYSLSDTLRGVSAANPFLLPGDLVFIADADQVFVVGNVVRPTALQLSDKLTLSQAIFRAGGLLSNSDASKIRLIRQGTNGPKSEILLNLKAIRQGTSEDYVLLPNDVIEVPREGGAKSALRSIMGAIIPTAMQLPTRVVY